MNDIKDEETKIKVDEMISDVVAALAALEVEKLAIEADITAIEADMTEFEYNSKSEDEFSEQEVEYTSFNFSDSPSTFIEEKWKTEEHGMTAFVSLYHYHALPPQ